MKKRIQIQSALRKNKTVYTKPMWGQGTGKLYLSGGSICVTNFSGDVSILGAPSLSVAKALIQKAFIQ